MKQRVLRILFVVWVFFWWLSVWFADDLLSKAFEPALKQDFIINIGNSKNTVGKSLTEKQTKHRFKNWNIFKKENWETKDNPPLFVRVAKILLRFTIALSVTMIIYNAILYGMSVMWGSDYWSKDSIKKLIYIAVGIVLALSSVIIINVIRSISTTIISVQ